MVSKSDESTTVIKPRGGKGKPRPLRRNALVQKAHQVLLTWSNLSPKTHPISVSELSKELNVSRQALYDNKLDKEINRYKDAQRKSFSAKQSPLPQKPLDQRVAELQNEVKNLQQKLDSWIERWAAVEYNARILGIDPDEIFAPIPNPQRGAMSVGSKRRRRHPK